MSVMWKYLDKRTATIRAMEDYENMQFIINNTDDEIKGVRENMVSIGSPNMDGMPHSHNPQAAEERIIDSIERIDILKERYRQAVEYMNWFKPAWESLSEDDQYVLESFYLAGDSDVDMISDHFGIERTSAYKKKNRAVERLVVKLYGKE